MSASRSRCSSRASVASGCSSERPFPRLTPRPGEPIHEVDEEEFDPEPIHRMLVQQQALVYT